MHSRLIIVVLSLVCPTLAPIAGGDEKLPHSLGDYEVRLNGERIGEEQFRVYKDQRYVLETTRTLYWPEPMRYEVRYELERSLEPREAQLVATRGGIVTELKLERKGENWRAEVKGQGRKKKKHELGRRAGTIVDFESPLFDALALKRMELGVGEHRQVEAIAMAYPDLVASREPQTYARVEDEELETPFGGTVTASVYELTRNEATHRLWLGPSGMILKTTTERPGNNQMETVLVRLKSPSGPWP